MCRLILRVAVALVTFMTGLAAAGAWNLIGIVLAPEPTLPRYEITASPLTAKSRDELEILEIIRQYDIAQTNLDADFFEEIEADNFTLTACGQTLTKAEDIALLKTFKGDTKFSSDDVHVQFYGNAAIVTGRMTADHPATAYRYSSEWRWIHLFVKRGGKWQIISTVQV